MFGIGFFEMVVIAVAILVLVGPKKLPEVMRQAGKFFVHVRRTTNDVRSTFDQVIREAEDDIRKKEIEELKNVLSPKSVGKTVDTESNASGDLTPDHSHTPDGSHKYNPYGDDYFKDPHHDPAHDHAHDHGREHPDHSYDPHHGEQPTGADTGGEKK